MSIIGNMAGCYSPIGKTFTLVDENNNEITGVIVDQEVVFTASDNDVREGMVYASDAGVSEGTKVIPAYHTVEGYRIITNGSVATIPNTLTRVDGYDYTKLQAMICLFNTNETKSVSTIKVAINNYVYNVQSIEAVSEVIKNHESKIVNLGVTNDSGSIWILRYFMYKEIK